MPANPALAQLAALAEGPGPLLVVLVGPNGAGKSTFYQQYLQTTTLPFVNADLLGRTLLAQGFPKGEETEKLAAKLADQKRAQLIAERANFITETVFSDPVGAKVAQLRDAQAAGYTIALLYIGILSADLSALRVESRVADGGHDVPRAKLAGRFDRMRANVKSALTFVDLGLVIDNSSLDHPLRFVASTTKGKITWTDPALPWWADEVLPG